MGKISYVIEERMIIMDIQKMKIEEVVEKINELYKISQERELNSEEKELQAGLRQRYLDNVKRNFRAQLDGIKREIKDSAKK